jgi:hypothetical protein
MVAPSFVTTTSWPRPMLCRILSCKPRQEAAAEPWSCDSQHHAHAVASGASSQGCMQSSPSPLAPVWSSPGLRWPWHPRRRPAATMHGTVKSCICVCRTVFACSHKQCCFRLLEDYHSSRLPFLLRGSRPEHLGLPLTHSRRHPATFSNCLWVGREGPSILMYEIPAMKFLVCKSNDTAC